MRQVGQVVIGEVWQLTRERVCIASQPTERLAFYSLHRHLELRLYSRGNEWGNGQESSTNEEISNGH